MAKPTMDAPLAEHIGEGLGDFVRKLDLAIESRTEQMVRMRRRLHATPEVSGREVHTTQLIAETMREQGLSPQIMEDGTGVLLDMDLGASSQTRIAVRSELDCVQINDDKQVPYASTHPGLCHACGHDAHSTMNLACTIAINELLDDLRSLSWRHNLRFIFQPAEETSQGARSMIRQGAIDNVQAIIAVHVDPFLETGRIGLRNGPLTAACKSFRVHVRGKSGHSARPFEAIDPVPAATNIVSMFYQLGPRSMDSRYPLSLTVSAISTHMSYNAIPSEAVIAGTLRAARVEDIEAVHHRMHSVCSGVATATGCDIELQFPHYAPATDNDPHVMAHIADAAEHIVGVENVIWLEVPSLGAEDFAFYQELIPGGFVRLGAALPDPKSRRPLHSSMFDINEQALPIGARLLSGAALSLALNLTPQQT